MKKFLLSALFSVVTVIAGAVPAKRGWRTVTQPDGTTITLQLVGDEFMHYYLTRDGQAVVQQDNQYVYARATQQGVMASSLLAHEKEQRTLSEINGLRQLGDFKSLIRKAQSDALDQARMPRKAIGAPNSYTGQKKGIIILMNFSDKQFGTSKEAIEAAVNQSNYHEVVSFDDAGVLSSLTTVGSVHDYFTNMSDSLFDLTFDVVGPYTASYDMSYYGRNNSYGHDQNVRQLIREAVNKADHDVNFKDYDWDGNGQVDQVFIMYAGYAEASGADANTIWPHESVLSSSFYNGVNVDGVYVNTYACSSELSGVSGTYFDGIGTIVHEFSHCLGLPDFYDTTSNIGNTSSNYGMFQWSVMDNGPYNGHGWIPAPYTGYERNFCGWLNYRELTEPCAVTGLKPITNGGEVYRITNPGNENEYYLLENRNANYSWDQGLYRNSRGLKVSGLMIYHITYDHSRFVSNTVNKSGSGYQCMTLVHADNSDATTINNNGVLYLDADGIANDLFPYNESLTVRHNEFSDTTVPADSLNYPNTDGSYFLHTKLSNISKAGATIRFNFLDGTTPWEQVSTGIDNVKTVVTPSSRAIYNLNGQYVGESLDGLKKGIYIQKGKKIVVK